MPLTIASVNVNGIRAAQRRGMSDWLSSLQPDVLLLQEVRADAEATQAVLGDGMSLVQETGGAKGRAGVAVASTLPLTAERTEFGQGRFADAGRFAAATVESPDKTPVVACSTYVHTGEATDPVRMEEKLTFLDAINNHVKAYLARGLEVIIAGDFNVARDERDIKNWKGNRGNSGFLPEEQARLDALCDLGMVDLGREHAGDVPGPYTWWSWRGRAYDNDAGWRIDYLFVSRALAARVTAVQVDRAPSYATRWSDHCPVVASFDV